MSVSSPLPLPQKVFHAQREREVINVQIWAAAVALAAFAMLDARYVDSFPCQRRKEGEREKDEEGKSSKG